MGYAARNTCCVYIFDQLILLSEPATGGVLAACGLREHCVLLFKPLLHFRMSVYGLAYVFTGGKGFLNDYLKFVVRPMNFPRMNFAVKMAVNSSMVAGDFKRKR